MITKLRSTLFAGALAFCALAPAAAQAPAPSYANRVFVVKNVNMASTGDNQLAIPPIVRRYSLVTAEITNCSATPVLAQVALYTAAAAGGTNLVAATTFTGATSAPVIVPLTLAANVATTMLTGSVIYVRVTVANAAALTCDVGVSIRNWSP